MSHDEMIAVIKAHRKGKDIECRVLDNSSARFLVSQTACGIHGGHKEWSPPCHPTPLFSFGLFEYRVKPRRNKK